MRDRLLPTIAALTLLAGSLSAQGAPTSERPAASGKVVAHSGGDVELRAPAARFVRVGGTVTDTLDGSTLGGARVELIGTRVSARSADDGRFQLGPVAPGRYSLRVTRIGYQPITIEDVRVPEDVQGMPLSVVMRRGSVALSEVIVTPGHFGLLQNGVAGGQSLSRETLETIPQLGEDIYRAVSRLPGVSADDFSAKFSVRGGSGDELYVSLDGLELVEPFHLKDVGGAFSIIDIQTLGTASLSTGGFSAEYGDRLTGVFTLKTSDPRTDGVHGSVGVSAMNARATLQGGFAGGKGGWLVSARPGYLDVALKFTEIADSIQPRYYDLFAKAQYDLSRGGRIALHVLRAGDSFRFLKKDEPNIFSSYGSSYGWLTWDDEMAGGRLRMQTRGLHRCALLAAARRELHGRRHADGGDRRLALARPDRRSSGLDARRLAEADVQVGRRREARARGVRLLPPARHSAERRHARRPERQRLHPGRRRARTSSRSTLRRACSCFRRSRSRPVFGSTARRSPTNRS